MIELHRLSTSREPFWLNPDLILSMESTPDCHITLTTGSSIAVCESEAEVVDAVRDWRAGILRAVAR